MRGRKDQSLQTRLSVADFDPLGLCLLTLFLDEQPPSFRVP